MEIAAVKTSKFYNKSINDFALTSMEKASRNMSRFKDLSKRMPQRLLGPTEYWEQFHRQADALEAAEIQSRKETVCTFVHQKEDGFREFIVAHPQVYWWYLMQMPSERRCSYEVIPEGAPCWLYFDLEFKLDLNPESDGPRMTETLIEIFSSYMEKYWETSWDARNIVNLDSTTGVKFSRHLIFCRRDVAFRDNFHVGHFVKGVCREIEEYLEDSSVLHDILSRFERRALQQLFVRTDKGKKIFVDTSVYTRNRHFRIYKSTKWGKISHLEVAAESKHAPLQNLPDRESAIFLDSLISYFPDKSKLSLLEIDDCDSVFFKSSANFSNRSIRGPSSHAKSSPFPELDRFIVSLVQPGKIRLCKQNENRKIITYEIIGNRYCANIGRQHKSNNVYWRADLSRKKVYQKCHDEDCADFASAAIDIPFQVLFHLDNEDDDLFLNIPEAENARGGGDTQKSF